MKIKVDMNITNCYECPFKQEVYTQGYCGTTCSKLGVYHTIPKQGIDKYCPFLSKPLDKYTKV